MARIVDEREVKQGSKGMPGFYVLIGSLGLAAVAMTGYLLWTGASSSSDPSQGSSPPSQESSRQIAPGGSSTSTSSTSVPPAYPAYPAPTQTPNPGATPARP